VRVDVVDRSIEKRKMARFALDPRERLVEDQQVSGTVA